METNNIIITDKLRSDIIRKRKEKGISAYDLSEQSGHSKFWLSNIENGKTKKISKNNLSSIYKVFFENEEDLNKYIKDQQIEAKNIQWHELIDIPDEHKKITNESILKRNINKNINFIYQAVFSKVENSTLEEMQAILTSTLNLYYSIYQNPELSFLLMNIPISGIKKEQYDNAVSDLFSITEKYRNLANNSVIAACQKIEFDKNKETVNSALKNFENSIELILDYKHNNHTNLGTVLKQFYSSVIFVIDTVQYGFVGSKTLGIDNEVPFAGDIKNGSDFYNIIDKCYSWFEYNQENYNLKVKKREEYEKYNKVKEFLQNSEITFETKSWQF